METPAGLYLHTPFCSAICPYCDFAVTLGGPERRAAFVESLIGEIGLRSPFPLSFDTLYLGGGTPSALDPDAIARILESVRRHFRLEERARVFLEANPEDVAPDALRRWRELDVATLSLGVQSFDDEDLRFLRRRHRAADARRCVELARDAGFETVSIDLIYGLPRERPDRLRRVLEEAIRLEPDHISAYQLTVEEGTTFGRRRREGRLSELSPAVQARVFEMVHEVLEDGGYEAYEVSNFAKAPCHRSLHNQKYWSHVPYLGLGPSAHSFSGTRRSWNERDLERWQDRIARGDVPVAGTEELAAADLALERVMLGLRTAAGIDLESLRSRLGYDLLEEKEAILRAFVERGLLLLEGSSVRPTRRGLAVADGLSRDLAPSA